MKVESSVRQSLWLFTVQTWVLGGEGYGDSRAGIGPTVKLGRVDGTPEICTSRMPGPKGVRALRALTAGFIKPKHGSANGRRLMRSFIL